MCFTLRSVSTHDTHGNDPKSRSLQYPPKCLEPAKQGGAGDNVTEDVGVEGGLLRRTRLGRRFCYVRCGTHSRWRCGRFNMLVDVRLPGSGSTISTEVILPVMYADSTLAGTLSCMFAAACGTDSLRRGAFTSYDAWSMQCWGICAPDMAVASADRSRAARCRLKRVIVIFSISGSMRSIEAT